MKREKNTNTVVEAAQETKPQQEETPANDPLGDSQGTGLQEECNRLKTEYDQVKAERDQLFDRLARAQAEFENSRKREARDRTEFQDVVVGRTVEQFLPVLDNFQLALRSSGSVEQLRAGVELIVKQMEEILRSFQVQPVETEGTIFDPRVHDAVENVKRTDLPDKQVLEEVRRGYRMRDRLLRPALVRVVDNPQQTEV